REPNQYAFAVTADGLGRAVVPVLELGRREGVDVLAGHEGPHLPLVVLGPAGDEFAARAEHGPLERREGEGRGPRGRRGQPGGRRGRGGEGGRRARRAPTPRRGPPPPPQRVRAGRMNEKCRQRWPGAWVVFLSLEARFGRDPT